MAKSEARKQARTMRQEGRSIKEIAKLLQVSVSSVSGWCRDVELSKEQVVELERRARDPHYGRRLSYSTAQRKLREEKEVRLNEEGRREIGVLSKRELFLVGVALYWAEGFKKDKQAGFANSNPEMVRLFIRWLIECCNYGLDNLSLRVTVNESHSYWDRGNPKILVGINGGAAGIFPKAIFYQSKMEKAI